MSQGYRRFVEIAPQGEDPDRQLGQIINLATSIGAAVVVRDEALLTPAALTEASQELWQSPVYGQLAGAALDSLRVGIEAGGVHQRQRTSLRELLVPALQITSGQAVLGSGQIPDTIIFERASAVLDGTPSPFPLLLGRKSMYSQRELDIFCYPPTKPKTAAYLTHNGFTHHSQRGQTGKALDTWLHASGAPLPDNYATHHYEGPFIEKADLLGRILEAGFTANQGDLVLRKIAKAAAGQIRFGNATDLPQDIIVETKASPRKEITLGGWDSIAYSSLESVASSYQGKSSMGNFLLELVPS